MTIVGHSMGALVASEFTAKHKEKISALVLISSAGIPLDPSLKYLLGSSLKWLNQTVKGTSLVPNVAHPIAKFIHLHSKISQLSFHDLCLLAYCMDEEKDLNSNPWFFTRIYNSILERFKFAGKLTRLAKNLYFMYYTWIYQMKIHSGRAKVFISIINDCPLLDTDHRDIFRSIGNYEQDIVSGTNASSESEEMIENSMAEVIQSLSLEENMEQKLEELLEKNSPQENQTSQEPSLQTTSETRTQQIKPETKQTNGKRKIPVRIIWGDEDSLTPITMLEKLKKCLPESQVLLVNGGDHAAFLQRPREVFNFFADLL